MKTTLLNKLIYWLNFLKQMSTCKIIASPLGLFLLVGLLSNAQQTIRYQGFETSAADNWNYSVNDASSFAITTLRNASGTQSMKAIADRSSSVLSNDNSQAIITFNTVSLDTYSDVVLSTRLAVGNPDGINNSPNNNEDFIIDFNINGNGWTTELGTPNLLSSSSNKLVDGKNDDSDFLDFSTNVPNTNSGTIVHGNSFRKNLSTSFGKINTLQIRFRVKAAGQRNIHFYIDDLRLEGKEITYCTPGDTNDARALHISRVQYGGATGVDNTSSFNNTAPGIGYQDFSASENASFAIGATINFIINTASDKGQNWRVNNSRYAIYIDFNDNGKFTDPGENILLDTSNMGSPRNFNWVVPATAAPGKHRMRIRTKAYWLPNDPCGSQTESEVEDYSITIERSSRLTEITGNNNLIIDGTTTTTGSNGTSFGSFDINSGAAQKVFVITNKGSSDLSLNGMPNPISITGDAEFSIFAQPSSTTLSSDESTTFIVAYDPTAIESNTATISVSMNDTSKSPYTFAISGDGKQNFPDTDGDGIADNIDVDDDNDGILDTVEQNSCILVTSASTVTKTFLDENFGTGGGTGVETISANNGSATTNYTFTDPFNNNPAGLVDGYYTVAHTANFLPGTSAFYEDYWWLGEDHTTGDTNGNMAMFNATDAPGEIFYQTVLSGVIPGVEIDYSFWVLNLDRVDCDQGCEKSPTTAAPRKRPSIRVEFEDANGNITSFKTADTYPNGIPQNGIQTDGSTVDWIQFSQQYQPTTSQFTVTFYNDEEGGLGNDVALDDIKITQTLCDIDQDGVADVIDIDNDNDGIPNVIEIGKPSTLGVIDADNDATTYNSNSGTEWVDTNNDGLHDAYAGYTPRDSDSDGIPDHLDLDSDNDGIFDVLENDGFGDLDTDGDGRGDGLDNEDGVFNDGRDGDGFLSGRLSTDVGDEGILTDFDNNDEDANGNSDDHGTGSYNLPIDTDGDGIPDYLDLYSNDATNSDASQRDILDSYYAALDNGTGSITPTTDTDRDGVNDSNSDFDTTIYGAPININDSYTIDFDGRNDYIELDTPLLSNRNEFTVMAWVLIDSAPDVRATIVSDGSFDLDINTDLRVRARATNAAGTIVSANINSADALTTGKWYHITATYDAPNELISIFVNGEFKKSSTIANTGTATTTAPFRIGRRAGSTSNDQFYFDGSIDEVRVFDHVLGFNEMRRIVYQEIDQNGTKVTGKFLVKDIDIEYSSMLAYFPFSEFVATKMTDQSLQLENATLYNIKSILPQSAPLPYVTAQDGALDDATTYVYDDVWDPRDLENTTASIVHIKHDVDQDKNYDMIGLQVDAGKTITVLEDNLLENSWQLNLDGTIDLLGDSQLIQTMESTLNAGANAKLLRSQDGETSPYSYNYWSSPVSTQDIGTSTQHFLLSDMLDAEDGDAVNFTASQTPAPSDPVTVSSNWLYTFINGLDYSHWNKINPSATPIAPGIGWSQKGSSNTVTSSGVMLFSGRPNNGTIDIAAAHPGGQFPITDNVTTLIGNPYPSAIDARDFIADNTDSSNPDNSVITGTLYLWEQFRPTSHILTAYEGGYATITAMGTTAASQYDGYGLGAGNVGETSPTAPTFYLPVAQGFYVTVNAPGTIQFHNSQRFFKTETSDNTVFFAAPGSNSQERAQERSGYQNTEIQLVRLSFESSAGAKRQLLLGFDDQFTTDHNMGYDGPMAGAPGESDMFIAGEGKSYVIKALPAISNEQVIDLTVNGSADNTYSIKATEFQNIDNTQPVYLWDRELDVYHDLGGGAYEYTLKANGTNSNRFAIAFEKGTLSSSNQDLSVNTTVYQDRSSGNLYLKTVDNSITQVAIYDLTGKEIVRFRESELENIKAGYNVSNVATGIYLAQIHRDGDYTAVKFTIE